MSKTKLMIALLAAHLIGVVQAQTPMTIQEWSLKQSELKRAEFANKLRETQQKGNPDQAQTVATVRTCDDDLQMSAVYGMGKNLRADFIYRGATVALSPGGDADMGGWFVQELTPTRAIMVKRGKGTAVKRCPLYLSAGTRDFTAPVTPMTMASDVPLQVPPITPVASSASGNSPKSAAAGEIK